MRARSHAGEAERKALRLEIVNESLKRKAEEADAAQASAAKVFRLNEEAREQLAQKSAAAAYSAGLIEDLRSRALEAERGRRESEQQAATVIRDFQFKVAKLEVEVAALRGVAGT